MPAGRGDAAGGFRAQPGRQLGVQDAGEVAHGPPHQQHVQQRQRRRSGRLRRHQPRPLQGGRPQRSTQNPFGWFFILFRLAASGGGRPARRLRLSAAADVALRRRAAPVPAPARVPATADESGRRLRPPNVSRRRQVSAAIPFLLLETSKVKSPVGCVQRTSVRKTLGQLSALPLAQDLKNYRIVQRFSTIGQDRCVPLGSVRQIRKIDEFFLFFSPLVHEAAQWRLLPEPAPRCSDAATPPPPLPCRVYGLVHLLRLLVRLPDVLHKLCVGRDKKLVVVHYAELLLQYLARQTNLVDADAGYVSAHQVRPFDWSRGRSDSRPLPTLSMISFRISPPPNRSDRPKLLIGTSLQRQVQSAENLRFALCVHKNVNRR